MDSFTALWESNPLAVLIVIGCAILLSLLVGAMMGNVTTLKLLNKLGLQILSGKVLKDYRLIKSFNEDTIGWLHIPDTCYTPIMAHSKGKYKGVNYFNHTNKNGELYLSDTHGAMDLAQIAYPSDSMFGDLSIIKGSSSVRSDNIRKAKFTYLRKYINSDLKKYYPNVSLVDNGKERIFNLLFAVEMGLEDRKAFRVTDRSSFIEDMRKLAFYDSKREGKGNIIILNGSDRIDSTLVFLVEREG